MLFYRNLDNIIFTRDKLVKCDELVIISGYVGPHPIRQLQNLPIKSTVVYGMYGCDGIRQSLHNALVDADNSLSKVKILYSTIPVHAKCYIWKYHGEVRSALVGSANFSTNGLTTPFKEVLADASVDTFDPLDQYIKMVMDKAIPCKNAEVSANKKKKQKLSPNPVEYDEEVCSMPLFIIKDGLPTVPPQSGINWGLAKLSGSHVNINDAYIRIGVDLLERYPDMFPKKQEFPVDDSHIAKAGHKHNDNIEILWDDGTSMTGLLEGSIAKSINGKTELYPKQISTTPSKSELGKYLRSRMGVAEGQQIKYEDLLTYGRTAIDVSLQGDGVYYFDFSVEQKTAPNTSTASTPVSSGIDSINSDKISTSAADHDCKSLSNVKIGDKVNHAIWGCGEIDSIKGNMFHVVFPDKGTWFEFPKAFLEGFLQNIEQPIQK